MELRLLRYFLTVAKEQSFTKAAEQLHITQPTLSRQMAALEDELGITLFLRNGKRISLTDEGILLKRRALEILHLEEKTLEELKGKEETFVCQCGYKEKLSSFQARRAKEGAGVNKRDVQRYLKKQQKEANEPVNNAFAQALSGIKLD